MSRNRPVVPQPTPRISCGTAIKKDLLCECRLTRFAATRFSFAGRCGSVITRRCHPAPPLRLDEGQQRTIGRRRRDANGGSTADTGTADRLLRGGKIGCRQHEAGTAALG